MFLFKILDKNIQNTLFKYSVYVENIFKTKMAYLISRKYGISIEQYLNEKNYYLPINFQRREKRNQTLKAILAVATDNKYKNDPTEYYKKYHNHIPAWILFKNVNFTDIIDLYSFLIIFLFLLSSFFLLVRLVLFPTKISNAFQLPPGRASC